MWERVRLDTVAGEWSLVERSEGKERSASLAAGLAPDEFVLWMGDMPTDERESIEIFNEVNALNGNRITRLTIGAAISKIRDASACPGECFCVVADGMRRCETQYCNDKICWWVPCGMGC